MSLTKQDKRDIAQLFADHQPSIKCPHGIDADTADNLKDLGKTWKIGKKAIIVTFFAGIASGLGGLIIVGIIAKIKSWI